MSWNNWCPDCIHLKACRRMNKILKAKGIWGVSRGCNPDCTAYISGNIGNYISSSHLGGKTLGELVSEAEEEEFHVE